MFKKILQSIVVAIMLLGCSGTDDVTRPKSIGEAQIAQNVFSLLQGLDDITFEQYSKSLATNEELLILARKKLTTKMLQQIKETINKWKKRKLILSNFNNLRSAGKKYGVVWKDIKFKGFINDNSYKLPDAYLMRIFFSYNGNYFEVKAYHFKLNGKSKLYDIKGLYRTSMQEITAKLKAFAKEQKDR